MQTVPLELPIERAAADTEQTRGDRLVAAHLLQGPDDVLALHVDQRRRVIGAAAAHTRRRTPSRCRCSCMLPARSPP